MIAVADHIDPSLKCFQGADSTHCVENGLSASTVLFPIVDLPVAVVFPPLAVPERHQLLAVSTRVSLTAKKT